MRRSALVPLSLALASSVGCSLVAGLRDWEEDGRVSADSGIGERPDSAQPTDAATDAAVDAPADAPDDAPAPDCDPNKPFGTPVLVPGLETSDVEGGARLSSDELTVYFASTRPAGAAFMSTNLWVATRSSRIAPWNAPALVPDVNTNDNDYGPTVSGDGRSLLFTRELGRAEIWGSKRGLATEPFPAATAVGTDAAQSVFGAFLSDDGGHVYFVKRPGGTATSDEMFVTTHAADNTIDLAGATALTTLNSASGDGAPAVSADELTIYFASDRVTQDDYEIYRAHRAKRTDPFDPPSIVANVNTNKKDFPSWVSADDCRLYLHGNRLGGTNDSEAIWLATRPK